MTSFSHNPSPVTVVTSALATQDLGPSPPGDARNRTRAPVGNDSEVKWVCLKQTQSNLWLLPTSLEIVPFAFRLLTQC